MTGFAAIFLALIATGIAAFSYFNRHFAEVARPGQIRRNVNGTLSYLVAVGLIGVAAVYLFGIILTDQFQYAYVFGYSAKDLPLAYKISAFWAGQEGSFLLWLVFHGVFGLILARNKATPPGVMAVFSVLQAILLTILLAKSPFMMLAEPRSDGAGLNPLLQDPWMVIHPPVVFLGYAGLAVPFAYAIGSLLANEHRKWLKPALAWTLLSWAALGAGIFIGGYWAYKVLGWGGYWAWDPVENSSLIPWLVCGALLHLLLLALRRPVAVKPAYLAAIFTFVLVLYGTFLTRSGILSNFSTHSFTDEGIGGLLAGLVMLTSATALIILIIKWPLLPEGQIYDAIKSREFMTAAGTIALSGLAALVLVGTSTPLVTLLLGSPQNVNTSFYNTTALPMTAVILVFLAVASLLDWNGGCSLRLKKYWWIGVAGLVCWLASLLLGVRGLIAAAVLGMAFAAGIACVLGGKKGLTKPAVITHAGVAVMIMGIIASSAGNQSTITDFQPGESKPIFGKTFTYIGVEPAAEGKGFHQIFKIGEASVSTVQTLTKLDRDGRPAVREPGIQRGLWGDIYVAPSLEQEDNAGTEVVLAKGEQKTAEGLTVKLVRYGMAGGDPQSMQVYALLETTLNGAAEESKPELALVNGQFKALPAKVFNDYQLTLAMVDTREGKVKIEIQNLVSPKAGKLDAEISQKPLISLVWLGTAMITLGTLWAGWRRFTAVAGQETAGAAKSSIFR
jgi:cytochrome c-type biogenesis protein CcmF